MAQEEDDTPTNGLLFKIIKASWYTAVMLAFMLASSVIFMGIEGNNEELRKFQLLAEQFMFNKSLTAWIEESDKAASLRRDIGLSEEMEYVDYEVIFQRQFEGNYTNLIKASSKQCEFADWELRSWQTKTITDSILYASSIVSTVGWGVYYPPSTILRLITIIYAIFGLPIFAMFIGMIMRMVCWAEESLKSKRWVRKYVGSGGLISALMALCQLLACLVFGGITALIVNFERRGEYSQLLEQSGISRTWDYFTGLYFTMVTVTSIGFGDLYLYSPAHCLLVLKPFLCLPITAVLIAVFSHSFNKLQGAVEKRANRGTLKSQDTVTNLRKGVKSQIEKQKSWKDFENEI